jgi:DNA end-binding protein Ku
VTIPVRLFPATEPKDVRFHLMDQLGRRVRYRRFVEGEPPPERLEDFGGSDADVETEAEPDEPPVRVERSGPARDREPDGGDAPPDEAEVAYGDLMRGFETDEGVVLLSQDEIEQARPERSRTIEIEDFVDLRDIDPVYFEKSYVVVPQHGSEKPYALLLRAIERSGRVGIGRFVLRTKPHLVAIRPREGVLGLETLFFGDEVRNGRSLVPATDAIEISDRELRLAEKLIETLETTWDPVAYADTYRQQLLETIAAKTPVDRPEDRAIDDTEPPSRRAEELMEALRASVEAAKKAKKRPGRKRPA